MTDRDFRLRGNFEEVKPGTGLWYQGGYVGAYVLSTVQEPRRQLGVGRHIGELINPDPDGSGYMPVFVIDDPNSPEGEVQFTGNEVAYRPITDETIGDASKPEASAVEYAAGLEPTY